MFVELIVLLREAPSSSAARDALHPHAGHRMDTSDDGVTIVAAADASRRIECSFGTTSVHDDPEWAASVAATDPAGWERAQPVVHQVDVIGRSLQRADLDPAYAVAIELAARCNGMVWDAVTEQPVGTDPALAAQRCAAALEQAQADYDASLNRPGFWARLFGR